MRSGFVELVLKNRLMGRQIEAGKGRKRYQIVDSFKQYIRESMPKMQQRIQIELLKKNLMKIKSRTIRQQLINAYLRRLFRLQRYQEAKIHSYKKAQLMQSEVITPLVDPIANKSIDQFTPYDIANYVLLNSRLMATVFKYGCFGVYTHPHGQFTNTKRFGIMARKESIGIVEVMRILQKGLSQKVNWDELKYSEQNLDENNYPILFSQLSNELYHRIQQYRNESNYMRIWSSSVISDTIVHSILQGLDYIDHPIHMLDHAIQCVMTLDVDVSPYDFDKRYKTLPTPIPLKIVTQPPKFASFYYDTPSFKSVFLGGEEGTGKSMILTFAAMWAHRRKWIVINVPDAYEWTQDLKGVYIRAYNGLYIIEAHSVRWLQQFRQANKQVISEVVFNKELYGQYDITGVHSRQSNPVPNTYDVRRQTYFNQIGLRYKDRLPKIDQQQMNKKLTDVLPQPQNLMAIIDAGLKYPEYSTCAIAELLNQIYHSDHLILQCVDSFTHFYRPSCYKSFRYFNDRGLYGHVPPYHISLCRLFMHLDGHKIKNGLKIVASSNNHLHKHKFDIKQIMLPERYEHKVPNLTMDEFRNGAQYAIISKWWFADDIQRACPQYAYTITQGNWGDFNDYIEEGYYY